ncbi:Cgr1 domain-containing protein [Rhizoctonia solani AG-1 IA]|uniref:Cgr1 domain-containing protein n=1 Tax=Thanatephorus cucumeris (strain AG1-IA) TaxID=983506 RepID=L8WTS8_THACA|nr:Cgr1 domain-containing protein [Rhizoctonia solani AG-1 IA]
MTTPVIPMSPAQPVEAATHTEEADFVPLAQTSNGRASGKGWKSQKTATKYVSRFKFSVAPDPWECMRRRSHMQAGVRAKSWEARMRKTAAETAVKRLHKEMIEEKAAEAARVGDEKFRRSVRGYEQKRHVLKNWLRSAKKAERLRKRAGRSKKVNG